MEQDEDPRVIKKISLRPIRNNPVTVFGGKRVGFVPLSSRPLNIYERVSPLKLVDFGPCIAIEGPGPERAVNDVSGRLDAEPLA